MDLALVRFGAQTFGASLTSTARPATTFFIVQAFVFGLLHYEVASLPASLHWAISLPALVAVAVVAVIENLALHDSDIGEVLHDAGIDKIAGAAGATTSMLLFAALGLPEAEAARLAGDDSLVGLFNGEVWAASAGTSTATRAAVVAAALATHAGLAWLRGKVVMLMADLDLGGVWAGVETGGVIGVMVLVAVLPVVAAIVVVALMITFAVAGLGAQGLAMWLDRRRRSPCRSCETPVRHEASKCPNCGSSLSPSRVLADPFVPVVHPMSRPGAHHP